MAKKAKDSMKKYAEKRLKQMQPQETSAVARGPVRSKSVDIKRADNGFIVSQYVPGDGMKPGRDRQIICKTMAEAQSQAAKLLKF
jgi:hypothetical protein